MLKRLFLAASLLILCTPSPLSACTCDFPVGSCQRTWKAGDIIFTGTVTKKITSRLPYGIDYYASQNSFKFSVSEIFRGFAVAGQEFTVFTDSGGGGCGYNFDIGTEYLVYASLREGKLRTSICTPTSRAVEVPHIIRQLRALQKGERAADLFGMIGTSPTAFTDDLHNIKPLAGKQVRVIGRNKFERSAITDDEGVFSFETLPPGTYRIEVDAPAGMSTWQLNKGETYNVDIRSQRASGCPVSITYSADGRIKGKVIDEDGNGVAGFVTIEPVDEKEAEIAKWLGGTMGYPTENGEFELWLLRPSQYRLIFHPKINGEVDLSVPAVKSEIITLGLGERFEDFRFKVLK